MRLGSSRSPQAREQKRLVLVERMGDLSPAPAPVPVSRLGQAMRVSARLLAEAALDGGGDLTASAGPGDCGCADGDDLEAASRRNVARLRANYAALTAAATPDLTQPKDGPPPASPAPAAPLPPALVRALTALREAVATPSDPQALIAAARAVLDAAAASTAAPTSASLFASVGVGYVRRVPGRMEAALAAP